MESSLDTFRAQREAVDQVHARLTEVSQLLKEVQSQVDAIAGNVELRAVVLAVVFALASAAAGGTGYAWWTESSTNCTWCGISTLH